MRGDQLPLPVIPVPHMVALGHSMSARLVDDEDPALIVGDYFLKKYRDRAAQVGVQTVARQLRKQGVDVEIAAVILAVRP